MTDTELRDLLDFAVDMAWRAGKVTLEYFQTRTSIELKPDQSVVTAADRRTEEVVRQLIRSRFPDHGIVGEEYGTEITGADYTWIIDPIDGTQSFVHGVPLYGVLIGLEYKNETLLGVINCPAADDMVFAARGEGCYWNGRRASVSDTVNLDEALVTTSGVEYFQKVGRLEAWQRLTAQTARYRTWGDCYGYALVATGRAEAMIDPIMHVWDCAPLLPIITEAGGMFTSWKGESTIRGGDAVATNGRLHTAVLSLLNKSGS
jgi:histidinol phosphatase-like enzyme (inositol monophosphatase family)